MNKEKSLTKNLQGSCETLLLKTETLFFVLYSLDGSLFFFQYIRFNSIALTGVMNFSISRFAILLL